jgi:hypothetical protein
MTFEGKLVFRVADIILCNLDQDPVSIYDQMVQADLSGKTIRITIEQLS